MPAPVSAGPPVDVLVARLADHRLGFPLDTVHQVLPAVAVEPLPGAPEVVRGLVNLRGELLPVLDLRARLGMTAVPMDVDHHLVTCTVGDRTVALHVDRAETVTQVDPAGLTPATDLPAAEHLRGVATGADGVLFVYDVRSFLAADEALQLDAALAEGPGRR